jgi:hypothetical protein
VEVIDTMSDASLLRGIGEHQVRLTEQEALLNLRTVLELCAAGGVRCSEKTYRPPQRPSAPSTRISRMATSSAATRSRRSRGRCWSRPASYPPGIS